ncbi:transposase, partial [Nonomuraea dietziae]
VVCRDGSAAYAEAIRQGAPDAVQVSDRWHLWNGLAAAVEKTVVTHSRCWHTAGPRRAGALAERTRRKHAQVHTLLEQGLGLGECARRLGWGFNTVKRYARAASADDLLRPPKYGATLVDPYREHLRRRLVEEPGVPVTHLLAEIRERGYTGSANLLVRYLNQGRADPRSDSALTTPAGLLAHEPPRRSTCSPPSAPGRADSRLPAPDSPGLAGAGVRRHPHPASRSRP